MQKILLNIIRETIVGTTISSVIHLAIKKMIEEAGKGKMSVDAARKLAAISAAGTELILHPGIVKRTGGIIWNGFTWILNGDPTTAAPMTLDNIVVAVKGMDKKSVIILATAMLDNPYVQRSIILLTSIIGYGAYVCVIKIYSDYMDRNKFKEYELKLERRREMMQLARIIKGEAPLNDLADEDSDYKGTTFDRDNRIAKENYNRNRRRDANNFD